MANNERLRLVTDMDGVIAHSQPLIIEAFNRRFGTNLTYADWTTFDLLTLEAVRLSGESIPIVAAWLYSEEVMRNSGVMPGSADAIKVLASLGVFPEVVTSRPSAQSAMTQDWMKTKVPEIKRVHVRGNEHLTIKGDQFKVAMIGQLEANIYVEDDPSVIQVVYELVSDGMLPHLRSIILVDRPWNDSVTLPETVIRVGNWREGDYGWNEIVQTVQNLQKEAR